MTDSLHTPQSWPHRRARRGPRTPIWLLSLAALALALAGSGGAVARADDRPSETAAEIDRTCDEAPFPSPTWTQCEADNYARQGEAPKEHLAPAMQARLAEQSPLNLQRWTQRSLADPSWLDPRSGNSATSPVSATWEGPYAGDPFRYPDAPGPDGAEFYDNEADVTPVVFYDRDCARLSGRVWAPKSSRADSPTPAVVFISGSVQATEALYWPVAQALVRAGYAVLTFDARGQGRSDYQAPDGEQGHNANLAVFWEGGVDAVDFFRSTPERPYPHNVACADTYPTDVTALNPIWDRVDPTRLGVAGQSAGALAASVIQGYGAPGAEPWPGLMDESNPVDAIVAHDSLMGPDGWGATPVDNVYLPHEVTAEYVRTNVAQGNLPDFGIRVPALSVNAEYHLMYNTPYPSPPDPERHKLAFQLWQEAGVGVYGVTFAGTMHGDQGMAVGFPATSNCPDMETRACRGGWGLPATLHYTVAWFDRWLKEQGEPGHSDADARLLADTGEHGAVKMSFRFRSARDYPDRERMRQHCEDIRAGCADPAPDRREVAGPPPGDDAATQHPAADARAPLPSTGHAPAVVAPLLLLLGWCLRALTRRTAWLA